MRLTTLFSLILVSTMMALAGPRHYSSNIPGDVNADGDVNIADVNTVIDAILTSSADLKCDVNGDGDINIADINYLIDIILTGPVIPTVDTGMYMGIIGYNQTLYTKDIAFLDSTTVTGFNLSPDVCFTIRWIRLSMPSIRLLIPRTCRMWLW